MELLPPSWRRKGAGDRTQLYYRTAPARPRPLRGHVGRPSRPAPKKPNGTGVRTKCSGRAAPRGAGGGGRFFEHTPGTGLSLACTYLYLSCVTCTVRPWEFPRSGLRPLVVTQGHRVPRFDGSSQIPTCGGNNRSTDPDINTVTHAPTDHRNMDIRTIHGVFTSPPRAACLVPTARELRV